MAKDNKLASTLATSVVTTIVTALAAGITAAKNSGSALVEFCKVAGKALPKTPVESDVIAIAKALSVKMGWEGSKRERQNMSEARALIRQHAYLQEGMTALRASEYGACGYHDLVSFARSLKEVGNVAAAVKLFNTTKKAKKADTGHKLELAVQAHYQTVSESKSSSKRAQLAALNAVAQAFGFETVKGAE